MPIDHNAPQIRLAALRWVKVNTATFGVDPGKVTMFGLSAGGAKHQRFICLH